MELLNKGVIFAFALSTVSTVAWAGGESQTRVQGADVQAASDVAGVSFQEADLDDSGFIDATEAKELDLDVVQYDTNYNGVIDRTEWERAPEAATEAEASDRPGAAAGIQERGEMRSAADMAGVTFEEADLDDSGAIDATEAKELGLDVAQFDTNYNGIIDRTEWERAPEAATEAEASDRPGAAAGIQERGADEMRSAADMAGVTFEEADLDDSGFVDATEAKELDLEVVQFDTNYNGIIDRTEWERAPEQATESERETQKQ